MPKPTGEALVEEIRSYCRAHADAENAKKYERYFKEGYDAWGLLGDKHALWTEKRPAWLEAYRAIGLKGFLAAGVALFESGKYEEGALAVQFVKSCGEPVTAKALPGLHKWFAAGIANWAHTDVLCGEILSPAIREGRLDYRDLAGWRASALRFERRAVPVAMLGLLKGTLATADWLEFLRPMMLDQERVVHQGLGWFLRELWKKDREPVEAFLLEFKDSAARLIFQYATEKMTAAEKARFKRAKKGA